MVSSRTEPSTFASLHVSEPDELTAGVFLSGGGNGVGMFEVLRRELDDEDPGGPFDYTTRLDIEEDHGPSVSIGVHGLEFAERD